MKKIIICVLLATALILCSCKDNNGGNNSYIYKDGGNSYFINTSVFKDSNFVDVAKFNEIKLGMTYEQIFNVLGASTDLYSSYNCKIYLLNNNKILSIKYEELTDICNYSGYELLALAKSYIPQNDIVITGKQPKTDCCFAIVVDDDFIFSADHGFDELSLKNSKIIHQDGRSASENDLTINSPIIVYYDEILESYPGILICREIVILDNKTN